MSPYSFDAAPGVKISALLALKDTTPLWGWKKERKLAESPERHDKRQ